MLFSPAGSRLHALASDASPVAPGDAAMSWQTLRIVKDFGPAALLLLAGPGLAGEHVRAARPAAVPSSAVPVPVVRVIPSTTISVTTSTPTQGNNDAAYINLRGPDGQLRRFPVEGGAAQMASRVIVLRPGQSLTIVYLPERK